MLTYSVHVLKVTQGILYNIILETHIDLPASCFSLDFWYLHFMKLLGILGLKLINLIVFFVFNR